MLVLMGSVTLGLGGCGMLLGLGSDDEPASAPASPDSGAPPRGDDGAGPAPTDLATDPRNCGAAGHDCLGGSCIGGQCQPFALASGEGEPSGIAVQGGRVYWASHSAGAIRTCTPPCASVTTLVNTPEPLHVVADANDVYWSSTIRAAGGATLLRCTIPTCTTPLALRSNAGSGGDAPVGIFLEGSDLYFASGTLGEVYRCKVDGAGCANAIVPLVPGQVGGVAASNTSVYASMTGGDQIVVCTAGTSCGPSPTSQAARFAETARPGALVAHDGSLYWTAIGDAGAVRSCPMTGPCDGGVALADNEAAPFALTVDGAGAYWTSRVAGTVRAAARTGGAVRVIASSQEDPYGIAVDARGVYWTNRVGGQVMMVVR